MADHIEEVEVVLVNDNVQFSGVSQAHPDMNIMFDYAPPIGDGKGLNGLEVLLMSLAGCSGTAVVYLLRKMRKKVSGFNVSATGIRRTVPPIKFETIVLKFIVESDNVTETEIEKAIRLAEESVCPVWQMIKNNVVVETEFRLLQP